VVALAVGIVGGFALAGASFAVMVRRMRAAMVREVVARVGPVLERRAAALGLPSQSSPEVDLGRDGELEVRHEDGFARLLRLADAINSQEQAQLGYLDTIRVAREDVAAELAARSGKK
jgi:hypothetical protein